MAIGPIGSALIGGGIKLLGGLFGSKKKRSNTVDYVALRNNAEKAGFNPLTALRNGGAAGFTTTSSPGLTSGELLADALGAGYQSWFNAKQTERDIERDTLEKDLMRAELHQIQQQSAVVRDRDFGFSIPQVTEAGVGTDYNLGNRQANSKAVPWFLAGSPFALPPINTAGGPSTVNQLRTDVDVPSARVAGINLQGSGAFSTGQQFEDAFGEFGGSALGLAALGDAVVSTTYRRGLKPALMGVRGAYRNLTKDVNRDNRPPAPHLPALGRHQSYFVYPF